MRRSRWWRGGQALAALVLFGAGAAAEEDRIMARVGGAAIRMSEISAILDRLPEQLRALPMEELVRTALDQLVASALLLEAARAEGLPADPEVQARLRDLEANVLRETYLRRRFGHIDEVLLRERYKELVADYEGPIEVRARHILVETETEAEAVVDALGSGADFATLARERSIDPTAAQGGDLGFIGKTRMMPAFTEVAFTMDAGTVSAPVRSDLGWHVIRVEERRSQLPEFAAVAGRLRLAEERATFNAVVAALKAKAQVEYLGVPPPAR